MTAGRLWPPDRVFAWPPHRHTVIHVAVWIGAAALCALLIARETRGGPWVGVARGRVVQLSVPWAARVAAVPVGLFQQVRRDEVVAILDHRVVSAQIEQVEAEIARLRAEHAQAQGLLEADVADREADWTAEGRAFARDASELAVRLREAEVDLDYDRSMLEGLSANATILERTVEGGHAAPAELELARAEAAATESRLRANERLVADLRTRIAEAESGRERHRVLRPHRPSEAAAVQHLENAIAVQRGLLSELQAQRDQSILRAPFDGTIVEIRGSAGVESARRPGEGDLRRPGEVIAEGEPVVAVAAERPSEIVVYDLDGRSSRLQPGREVELRSETARLVASSAIEAIGPTVERLPESLWGPNQMPLWGRPMLVPIPPGFDVAAGDPVEVRLR